MPRKNRHGSLAREGYRSGFEGDIADSLTARGVPFDYESEKIAYEKPARKATYTPDFILIKPDDTPMVVEAKGYFRSSDRQKLRAVKASNPDLDLRLVFGRAGNRLNKTSATTYAAWAEKYGFPWAEGDIPDEWIAECVGD